MDNKQNILQCALKLFSEKGYDSVGVQEIVLKSEITKPTLYHYFGSKKGLLDSLLKENFTPFFLELKKTVIYNGDLPLTLFRVTKTFFLFAIEKKCFYRFQMSLFFAAEESEPFKSIHPFFQEQYLILEELFLRASDDHGNMKGRHKAYAATFIGMLNTYINLYLHNNEELNDECIYKAVHQFMHGIYS